MIVAVVQLLPPPVISRQDGDDQGKQHACDSQQDQVKQKGGYAFPHTCFLQIADHAAAPFPQEQQDSFIKQYWIDYTKK